MKDSGTLNVAGKSGRNILQKAFWVLFIACFSLAFVASIRGNWMRIVYILPVLALLFLFAAAYRLKGKYLLIAYVALFAATFVFQCWWAATQYYVPKTGDMEAIYTGVNELMQNAKLTLSNPYFLRYPHQNFTLVELYVFRRFIALFGITQGPGVYQAYGLLTVLGIDIAVGAFTLTVKLWKNTKAALISGMAALALFSPLRFAVTYAYTHMLAYPYLFCSILLLSMAVVRKTGKRWQKGLLLLGSAVLLALAALAAGSATVVLVAVGIFLFLKLPIKQALVSILIFLVGFGGTQFLFNQAWHHSKYIDMSTSYEEVLPYTHYIAMGLNRGDGSWEGTYNEDDYQQTVAIQGENEKKAYLEEKIAERTQEAGYADLIKHQWNKLQVPWGYLAHQGSILSVRGVAPFNVMNEGVLPACILMMLVNAVFLLRKKSVREGDVNLVFLCSLVLLGVLLFLQIWEASFFYLFPYLLFFIPPVLMGTFGVLEKVTPLLPRVGKNRRQPGDGKNVA